MEESEKELQDYFINLLIDNGYEEVLIKNEEDLIQNFKEQLKLFNKGIDFNFNRVLSYLYQGDRDLKFNKLRNSFDGIKFIDFSDFSNNIFQVSQEISVVGDYINRYDVTILINGLPLVQIELKKSGVGLKEAFNQIQRYSNQSYSRLFDLIQIFIISNKVNTKYFFNDSIFNYNLASNWGDFKDLKSFTNSFLVKENLMKVLSEYIFKDYFTNSYQMLRHYQIDAIEGILDRINEGKDGYVWMSSNTGKLTTSFRLAEILKGKYQIIYVATEYLDKYPKSFVTRNNWEFLHAIGSQDLIITNIRSILSKPENLDEIKDGEYIFIFNEYEKYSQRYSPDKLMNIFTNSLFYCFTSAPVFDENVMDDRTTKSFFSDRISSYTLRDAIRDKTNLIMDCEYLGDEGVTSEYDLSSDLRIEKISEHVIENAESQSLLIVSSNDDLIRYHGHLKKSDLKVAAVLRHDSNDIFDSKPMRDYFEEFINEYNRNFNADVHHRKVVDTSGISRDFDLDVIKRFNNGEIELLVVDEGVFYDKYRINLLRNLNKLSLNTIFLDCNLNYDMLFEALMMVSGTDLSHEKSANVRIFRDIRKNIKQTVKLYSNDNASESIILKDYNHYLNRYNHYKSKN